MIEMTERKVGKNSTFQAEESSSSPLSLPLLAYFHRLPCPVPSDPSDPPFMRNNKMSNSCSGDCHDSSHLSVSWTRLQS